jgi:hypothetical protein
VIVMWPVEERGNLREQEIAPMDRILFPDGRVVALPDVPQIPHQIVVEADTFWEQYLSSLNNQGWNNGAIEELEKGIDGVLENINLNEDGRINRTSMIGEVQSGKTASMVGLAAKGLDAGFRLIVVLAGHQNDLRNQAAKRFNRDLLLISEKIGQDQQYWTIDGTPPGIFGVAEGVQDGEDYKWTWLGQKRAYGLPSHCDLNKCQGLSKSIITAVRDGGQAVLITKKTQHSMDHCMNMITDILRGDPSQYPIMVIDDESDYATMPPPRLADRRVWKPMIKRNWNLLSGYEGGRCLPPRPRNPLPANYNFNVYAIEYTATPQLPHRQAEFIHSNGRDYQNLFYSRYHKVMKSASDQDTSIEYDSQLSRYGKFSWYTGPEMFYGQYWNQRPPLEENEVIQHPTPNLNREEYSNPEGVVFELTPEQMDFGQNPNRFECGLISYFVAGAIRFAQQDAEQGGSCEQFSISLDPDSFQPWPETHSALIHNALLKDDHWNQATEVLKIFGDESFINRRQSTHTVNPRSFINWLGSRENEIRCWYDYFHTKYTQVVDDGADRPDYPGWRYVWTALEHWSSFVRIKVLNSDPNPKIPLDFDPRSDSAGNRIRPQDVYTIIIGGNCLSRGLTIEGLCTTIFGRLANTPNQATMMQHQRWCGYRGNYWEYVTLHIDEDAKRLLSIWSAADQVDRKSHASGSIGPLRFTVLNDNNGRAIVGAAKLPAPITLNLRGDFQFRHVELEDAENNELVMANFIERVLQNPQRVGAHVVNTDNTMSAVQVADMLDQLEYTSTGTNWRKTKPLGGKRESNVFVGFENWFSQILDLDDISLIQSNSESSKSRIPFTQNPKLIAAYLRLWDVLYHHGEEVVEYLKENELLELVGYDFAEHISEPPEFNLVFQGGEQRDVLCNESMHPIFRDDRLTSVIPNTIRKAAHRSFYHVVNQMRTGNRANLPGGNRYVDLHLGDDRHPRWIDGRFMGYGYDRGVGEPGVVIGQAFERAHLYDETNTHGAPPVPCDPHHIPVSFMIDIPAGGPSFIIT